LTPILLFTAKRRVPTFAAEPRSPTKQVVTVRGSILKCERVSSANNKSQQALQRKTKKLTTKALTAAKQAQICFGESLTAAPNATNLSLVK
jgi:hypothetical protein